jgi:hypothetical protein
VKPNDRLRSEHGDPYGVTSIAQESKETAAVQAARCSNKLAA